MPISEEAAIGAHQIEGRWQTVRNNCGWSSLICVFWMLEAGNHVCAQDVEVEERPGQWMKITGGGNEYVKVDNAVAGQWCEARVSQAPFILSFPFPLINRTRYKGEGEREGGCQRSSSCKLVYQPCSVNMPSEEARLPRRPPNRLILELWGKDGVQLDFEAILSVCLPPSPSLCMSVCALSVLKGLFHAADWRVLHYPSHKRTSSLILWTF